MSEPQGSKTESFIKDGVAEVSGSAEVAALFGVGDAAPSPDNTAGGPKPAL